MCLLSRFTRPYSLLVMLIVWAAGPASPPRQGDQAPDFTLKSLADDRPVRLETLTEQGPVVLVVLRGWPGYQCPMCTAQASDLARQADAFRARKARVVMVYPGPADGLKAHAEEFASGKGLPEGFDLVLDPDYAFTNAYGLRWDAPKETAYPSTFVIGPGRRVSFAKVSREHGGRAKAAEVLKALGG